jgi:D-amino-acid oxidase
MSSARQVVVLGAGVSGLTTAVCLAEARVPVRVLARDLPERTTSCAAGAMWGPLLVEHDEVDTWSQHTLDVFTALAAKKDDTGEPVAGVRLVDGIEASKDPAEPAPAVVRIDDFRWCEPAELPAGFVVGWRYTAPLIDMPVYLAYLTRRLADAGVKVETATFGSLAEAVDTGWITVNCTGFGAADLVPDAELRPVRGQLVVAENPGLDEYFAEYTHDEADMTYYLPMGKRVILGGCAEGGGRDLAADPATLKAIVARCVSVEPRLADARILGHRVGLRPARRQVRVERDTVGGADVIHNYGHGGAGVSLSWGCAAKVRELVHAMS